MVRVAVAEKLTISRSRQICAVFFRSGQANHWYLHQVRIPILGATVCCQMAEELTDLEIVIESVYLASWLLEKEVSVGTLA